MIPKATIDSTTLRVLDIEDKHSATSDHQAFKQNEDQAATGEDRSAHTATHTAHTYAHTTHSLASQFVCFFCHLVRTKRQSGNYSQSVFWQTGN